MLGNEALFTFSAYDPEFEYLKYQKLQAVGNYFREEAKLDKWVDVANQTGMSIFDWISLDNYWQEAAYQAVKNKVDIMNKKSQEESEKMMRQINDNNEKAPYSSPFNSIAKPTFQLG